MQPPLPAASLLGCTPTPGDLGTCTELERKPRPVAAGDAQSAPPTGPHGQGSPVCGEAARCARAVPGRRPRHQAAPGACLPPCRAPWAGPPGAGRGAGETAGPALSPGSERRPGEQDAAGRPPRSGPRLPGVARPCHSTLFPQEAAEAPAAARPLPRPRCHRRPVHLPRSLRPARAARGLRGPEERGSVSQSAGPRPLGYAARASQANPPPRPSPPAEAAEAPSARAPGAAAGPAGNCSPQPASARRGSQPEPQFPEGPAAVLTLAAARGTAAEWADW